MSSAPADELGIFSAWVIEQNFKELSRFEITGRGTAIAVKNPRHPLMYDPCQLTGKEIRIDGKLYRVRATETFAILRSPDSPYTHDFSVLIEEL